MIGVAGDISRFASRDHFGADNGTAPVEVSSGERKTRRLYKYAALHAARLRPGEDIELPEAPSCTCSSRAER